MKLRLLIQIFLLLGVTYGLAQEELDQRQIAFNSAWSDAIKFYLKNDYANALEYADKALKYNKNDAACYYLKGQVYVRQSKFEMALENFRKASKLAPDNVWYVYFLAQTYFAVGNFQEATDLFKKVIELQPYQTFFYQLLDMLVNLERPQEALEIAKQYEDYYGFDLKIANYYLYIYGALNDTVKQISTLKKIISLYPNSKHYINLYLEILKINDKEQEFLEFYQQHPDNPVAQLQIFYWYLKHNNIDSALILIDKIIKSNDIEIKRKLKAVRALSEKTDKDEYLRIFAKLYENNKDPLVCTEYSELLANNLLLDSSINVLLSCSDKYNYDYDIYKNLSYKLLLDGRLKTADTLLGSAINIFPNQPDLFAYLALTKALLNDRKQAGNYLKYAKTMDFEGRFIKLENLTEIILLDKSNKVKAQALLTNSLDLLTKDKDIALYISTLSYTSLNIQSIFDKISNPDNPYIVIALARYYLNRNQKDKLESLKRKYPELNLNKSLQ